MSRPTARPPRLASALVATLLWGSRREVVLGDLDEAFHRRLHSGTPVTVARRRYRWEALASLWAMLRSGDILRDEPASSASGEPNTHRPRPRGDTVMAAAWDDFRFSTTALARRPGLALIVTATLALGIGIGTTVFSVVEATLLRNPPVHDPDRLVMVWNRQAQEGDQSNLLSAADYADLRDRSRTLESVGAFGEIIVAPVVGTEQPSFGRQVNVTANFFDMLGVKPHLGRLFEPADGVPPDPDSRPPPIRTLVISHDYWLREFGGDVEVVGRSLRTFSSQYQIVGVLPPGFQLVMPAAAGVDEDLGTAIDLWAPWRFDLTQASRTARWFRVVGRQAAGSTLADVRGELDAIAAGLRAEHEVHAASRFALGAESYVDESAAHLTPLLGLLGWAVACVLLVACVNASGLMLTRLSERELELSVRAALGAGRWHLARLTFTEATLLAGLGGLLGVLVARLGMDLVTWLSPAGLPQADQLSLNPKVLAFALLVAPLCAALTGLIPVLRAMAHGQRDRLTVRGSSASRGQRRLREGLVALQIALTVILLVASGLLLRSFTELQKAPLGFEPDRVLAIDISTVAGGIDLSAPDRIAALRDWVTRRRSIEYDLSRALQDLPGVEAAGAVFPVPLNGIYSRTCTYAPANEGRDDLESVAYFRNVWPGYFDTLQIPLLAGRDFVYADDPPGLLAWLDAPEERTGQPRVVIDQRLAEQLWPGQNALGRTLRYNTSGNNLYFDAEVIGVVPYVPQSGLDDTRPTIYIPRSYYRSQELTLAVRVAEDSPSMRQSLTETLHAHFPESPALFRPLDDYVDKANAANRFVLTLVGAFAATALLLAAVGLYATLALAVRQRATAIGIQMAIGAAPRRIFAEVMQRSLFLTAAGIAAGLVPALLASRLIEAYLYEVSSVDPLALTGTILVQGAVAVAACWIPARRAARLDPIEALRAE
ncbi:MAG: ADOP family duplicated permease [Acidobacteriota bacterium]